MVFCVNDFPKYLRKLTGIRIQYRNQLILIKLRKAYDSISVIKVTEKSVKKEFPVYRGVLCFHSEFFKRALSDRWQNGSASVYNIEDTKIAIFEMFFNWMNTDHLLEDKKSIDHSKQTVELYKFADFYAIPSLKNRAMEAFFHSVSENKIFNMGEVASIYKHTTQHDLFRKLVVDLAVDTYRFDPPSVKDKENAYEFLMEVIMASRAKKTAPGLGRPVPWKEWKGSMAENFCAQYHYHGAQDTEVAPEPSAK